MACTTFTRFQSASSSSATTSGSPVRIPVPISDRWARITTDPSPLTVRKTLGEKGVLSSARSEEHTSELQSHSDLVCRLLLEKKTILHGRKHLRASHLAASLAHLDN